MAQIKDGLFFVKETTTTTGDTTPSFNLTLAGPVSGFESFSSRVGTGNECFYFIRHNTAWQYCRGTFTSPSTLSVAEVLASSDSDNPLVLTAGTKYVYVGMSREMASGLVPIVSPTSFPAANVVAITDIPQYYSGLILIINGASCDTATRNVNINFSTDNGSNYATTGVYGSYIANGTAGAVSNQGSINIGTNTQTAAQTMSGVYYITGYQAGPFKAVSSSGNYADSVGWSNHLSILNVNGINALRLIWNSTGNFDSGTYSLYGVL